MKISIITVCYNSEKTIQDTIESVYAQNYPNLEHIIIDGGSEDNTMSIVKRNTKKITKIISEPDRGTYDAMNKGIQQSTGHVIGFLNSDDVYIDSSALTKLVNLMTIEKTDTVFSDLVYVHPTKLNRIKRYFDSGKFSRKRLRFGWMPAHPTLLVKREMYEKCGLYSLKYKIASDFEMVARLFHSYRASYSYYPAPLIKMRLGGVSTSGIKSSWIINCEMVEACRENGIQTSIPLLAFKLPTKLLQLFPFIYNSKIKNCNDRK